MQLPDILSLLREVSHGVGALREQLASLGDVLTDDERRYFERELGTIESCRARLSATLLRREH